MFDGKHTRWIIFAPGHDLEGDALIELKGRDYSRDELLVLIQELMDTGADATPA